MQVRYVLVPVDPTDEMIEAAAEAGQSVMSGVSGKRKATRLAAILTAEYKAAIAAAPRYTGSQGHDPLMIPWPDPNETRAAFDRLRAEMLPLPSGANSHQATKDSSETSVTD